MRAARQYAWGAMDGRWITAALIPLVLGLAAPARGNDVLPRLFTNAPINMNYVSLTYTRSDLSLIHI